MDVAGEVPDLQVDRQLRIVDIHLQVGIGLGQQSAHVLAQLNGGHGEGLIAALGLHLKALGAAQLIVQIGAGRPEKGVRILLAGLGPGQGRHAEELL